MSADLGRGRRPRRSSGWGGGADSEAAVAASTPAACGAARCHHERGGEGRVRWRRRAPRWARAQAAFRCAAPSRPGFRPVGLGALCALGRLCSRSKISAALRCGGRGSRTVQPLCGKGHQYCARAEPGPVPCALHARPSGPCPRPVRGNRGSESKSVAQGHSRRELEFEPKLPNSKAPALTPHLAGRLGLALSPPHTAPPLCHLTFLPPLGWSPSLPPGIAETPR